MLSPFRKQREHFRRAIVGPGAIDADIGRHLILPNYRSGSRVLFLNDIHLQEFAFFSRLSLPIGNELI